ATPPATAADRTAAEHCFMALLGYVWMYASDAFEKYRQAHGLNLTQSRILFTLSGGTPLSLDEIVARSFLPREPAEDAIDSLSVRGFVTRQNDAFSLTKSGRELFARLGAQVERFESEQFVGIAKQDIDAARKVLESLHDRLKPRAS